MGISFSLFLVSFCCDFKRWIYVFVPVFNFVLMNCETFLCFFLESIFLLFTFAAAK